MSVRASWALRLLVSLAILGVLFVFVIPLDGLSEALAAVSPSVIVTALVLFMIGHVVAAFKWRLLVQQPRATAGPVLRAHFAGLVTNLCLPGVAGGDVVRAAWLMRTVERAESVAVASVADRGIDVCGLLLLVGCGWLVTQGHTERLAEVAMPVAGLVLVGVLAAIGAARLLARRTGDGLVGRLAAAVRVLLARPGLLLIALVLSVSVQATFVAINAWLGYTTGVDVSTAAWFVAWPLAKLVALVPISLGGIGVREAALAALLAPFGADTAAVVAVGLLWELILIAGGGVGWLVTTVAGRDAPTPAAVRHE